MHTDTRAFLISACASVQLEEGYELKGQTYGKLRCNVNETAGEARQCQGASLRRKVADTRVVDSNRTQGIDKQSKG